MTLTTSVILPTHDRPQHLRQAMESLLIQSRLPDEVIIVSDGEQEIPGRSGKWRDRRGFAVA